MKTSNSQETRLQGKQKINVITRYDVMALSCCHYQMHIKDVQFSFGAEKRNKHARVLALRQSPKIEKMVGIASILQTKEATNFLCFCIFPGK